MQWQLFHEKLKLKKREKGYWVSEFLPWELSLLFPPKLYSFIPRHPFLSTPLWHSASHGNKEELAGSKQSACS